MRFCVLASGSSGNASLLIERGFGVLIDVGLGPRSLAGRMDEVGACWEDIHAALLTHIHGDHWNERTLIHLHRRGIPLYCHRSHARALKGHSEAFAGMLDSDNLRFYEVGRSEGLCDHVSCRPFEVRHDGGMTCGFRFDGSPDFLGQSWSLGYATDLGSWDADLAAELADVDLLALEFNHDEVMERQSRRSWQLIERVLGDHGHLSNSQAARLVEEILRLSSPGRLRHLVQLHLSGECNRPRLARTSARRVLFDMEARAEVHTAEQHAPGRWLRLRGGSRRMKQVATCLEWAQPLLWDA